MARRYSSELDRCVTALSVERSLQEEELMNEMKEDDFLYEMPKFDTRSTWRVVLDLLRSPFCHHEYLLIYKFKSVKGKNVCIENHYCCRKCKRRTKKVWTYEV